MSVSEQLRNVEHLDLSDCHRISDTSIAAVLQNNTALKQLLLEGCFQLTDHGLATSIGDVVERGLQVLNLSHTGISDATVFRVASCAGPRVKLQQLMLDGCAISHHALESVAGNGTLTRQLRRLGLGAPGSIEHGTERQFAEALLGLIDRCNKLVEINVSALSRHISFLPETLGMHSRMHETNLITRDSIIAMRAVN